MNSYLRSSHPIVKTVILIAINPKTLFVIIFANKQLLAINTQTCNADTICCCAFKLKLIIDFVDLICLKAVFKFIKTSGDSCNSFSIVFYINGATIPIVWTIVFVRMGAKILVFTGSDANTIFILKRMLQIVTSL